ncbi:MAG: RHS repeat-associated core domain-containing protein [Anaerolineae bacterium]
MIRAINVLVVVTLMVTSGVVEPAWVGDASLAQDGVPYTWDDNGNPSTGSGQALLSDGTRTYSYDAADRLVGVSGGGVNASYTYNGDGLRVGQTINGQGTTFTWDVAAALPQVLATSNGAAYVHGLSLLAQQQAGAWQYPLPDGLGSVRHWTDASSQVTYVARYAPFGALLWQQGTAPGPWGFAGEMQDPTGLIYLRARWYDPATGRFLTRDPVPGVPMLPASLNPYVYALNNPVLYTDPSGEFIIPLLLGAAIGGGFAAYNYWQAQPCATFPSALSDPAFQRAVGIGMLTGAVGGLIGSGVAILGAGAFYGGLSGAIISGAVGGGLAGGAMEAVRQAVTYGHVRNPQLIGAAMLSGVVSGGVLSGLGYGIRQAARSVWRLPPLQRGTVIHQRLGQNLPQNFPVIDRFANGTATSIKSLDLNAPTYQNIGGLTSKVQGYINTLASFPGATRGNIAITAPQITGRVVELAVPPGATPAQSMALQQLQQYASSLGVTLQIVVVP